MGRFSLPLSAFSSSLARPSIDAFPRNVAALRAALQGAQRACRRGAAAGEAKPRGSRKFLSRIVSADISFDNIFARPLAICTELLGLRRRPWPRKAKKGHVGPTAEPLGEVSGMG